MRKASGTIVALVLLCSASYADVFNLSSGLTNLEVVRVSDPGNSSRVVLDNWSYGTVDYTYGIGKYEVTAAQYCDFLNHKAKSDPYGLYNTSMDTANSEYGCNIKRSGTSGSYSYSVAADWANRPVNYVSFWDACRFANWLNNGQGDGDTETGAYTLNDYNGSDGRDIQRNVDWGWAIASENEWYKAAYYKGGGTDAGYWDYPTQSNDRPSNVGTDGYIDPGNHANYWASGPTIGSPYYRTNAGEFENSASAYGTFDQGGNVFEWTDATYAAYRIYRGGSFGWINADYLSANSYPDVCHAPTYEDCKFGFRVVQAVPEPSSASAILPGIWWLSMLLRKKQRHTR